MICSAKELGLNDKLLPKEQQEGILVLPEDAKIGTPIAGLLGLDDKVLDFDLTPNRSDCLSMLGAAYEVGAILGRDVKLPKPEKELIEFAQPAEERIAVKVEASELCSRYAVRYISGVKIGPSPLWMQNRLMAAGIRPISNVVDITNYVMLEYGQPLHAFDADKIAGGQIGVRQSREGEKLVTLDGQERELEPGALLIVDGDDKPAGLAGVMGGLDSEVTDRTVNIVLESAKFDGGAVRKTSRALGLRSEASQRFEKEVDPSAVIPALNRAAELMAKYAGGNVCKGIVEVVNREPQEQVITLSLGKLNDYLGTDISTLETKNDSDPAWLRQRRFDRKRSGSADSDPAGRHHPGCGFNRRGGAALRLRQHSDHADRGPTTAGGCTKPQALRRAIRSLLVHGGWQEVLGYSFIRAGAAEISAAWRGRPRG